jgi:hypothetical protein
MREVIHGYRHYSIFVSKQNKFLQIQEGLKEAIHNIDCKSSKSFDFQPSGFKCPFWAEMGRFGTGKLKNGQNSQTILLRV